METMDSSERLSFLLDLKNDRRAVAAFGDIIIMAIENVPGFKTKLTRALAAEEAAGEGAGAVCCGAACRQQRVMDAWKGNQHA